MSVGTQLDGVSMKDYSPNLQKKRKSGFVNFVSILSFTHTLTHVQYDQVFTPFITITNCAYSHHAFPQYGTEEIGFSAIWRPQSGPR